MSYLGIDVGGSGIKGALVDTRSGDLLSERHRIETPQPSTPANVAVTIRELVSTFDYDGAVGCCFPAVIRDGQAMTAGNIDKSWRGQQVDALLGEATGLPFVVLNDADAAAEAEMRLGAGVGLAGTVITVTIGTGLGSGVFRDGRLVPNIELGRMPGKDGEPIEFYASNKARKDAGLDWAAWGPRFNYFLERVTRVMAPDCFILGGGASKRLQLFEQAIRVPVPIRVARFRNEAGIIGAAKAAEEATFST